jgi:ATP-dependent Clp protease ATP-binding subunit ClpC
MLAEKGYDPTLGARPLRRAIQRLLEDELSEKVLFGEFSANTTIVVDVDPDEEGTLTFSAIETPDHPDVELAESEG